MCLYQASHLLSSTVFVKGTYYRNDELNMESQDFPLVLDLRRRIAADRSSAALTETTGASVFTLANPTPFDRWFIFAALDQLYYYNFADGQASWEPPHFALQAAHQIQKVARGRAGRAEFKKKQRSYAATRIQAQYRSKAARDKVDTMKIEHLRKRSATRIQTRYRGLQGRKRAQGLAHQRAKERAARGIQRHVRGREGRRRAAQARERRREKISATVIQSRYRSKVAIRHVDRIRRAKSAKLEKRAATSIQRIVRGRASRQSLVHRRRVRAEAAARKKEEEEKKKREREREIAREKKRKEENLERQAEMERKAEEERKERETEEKRKELERKEAEEGRKKKEKLEMENAMRKKKVEKKKMDEPLPPPAHPPPLLSGGAGAYSIDVGDDLIPGVSLSPLRRMKASDKALPTIMVPSFQPQRKINARREAARKA